jgi:hypothetical protein
MTVQQRDLPVNKRNTWLADASKQWPENINNPHWIMEHVFYKRGAA